MFYFIYLNFDTISLWLSVAVFLPQAVLLITIGYKYYLDLPFCIFAQTFVFVMYNKVSTAQYFVWYHVFLSLILANNDLMQKGKKRYLFGIFLAWLSVLMVWNYFALELEIQGNNKFFEMHNSISHFDTSE